MSDISKIQVNNTEYNVKDSVAREDISTLSTYVSELSQKKATSSNLGMVKPDDTTLEVDENGVISIKTGAVIPEPTTNSFRVKFMLTEGKDYDGEESGYLVYFPFIAQDLDQNTTIDWGDDTTTTLTAGTHIDGYIKHVYSTSGIKTVTITCDNTIPGVEDTMPKISTEINIHNYEELLDKTEAEIDSNQSSSMYNNFNPYSYNFTNTVSSYTDLLNNPFTTGSSTSYVSTNFSMGYSYINALPINKTYLYNNNKFYGIIDFSVSNSGGGGSWYGNWYLFKVGTDSVTGNFILTECIQQGYVSSNDYHIKINLLQDSGNEYFLIIDSSNSLSCYFSTAYWNDEFTSDANGYIYIAEPYQYGGGFTMGNSDGTPTELVNEGARIFSTSTIKNQGLNYIVLHTPNNNSGTITVYDAYYSSSYYSVSNGTQYDLATTNLINIPIYNDYIIIQYTGMDTLFLEVKFASKELVNFNYNKKANWRNYLLSIDTPLLRMKGNGSYQTSLASMFRECSKLAYFPETFFSKIGKDLIDDNISTALQTIFAYTGLESYPANFLKASYFTNNVNSLEGIFTGSKLTSTNLLGDAISTIFTDFHSMYTNCKNLTTINSELFDNIIEDYNRAGKAFNKTYDFRYIFSGTSITSTNKVFTKLFILNYWTMRNDTVINRYNFSNAFTDCPNLEIKLTDFVTSVSDEWLISEYIDPLDYIFEDPEGNNGFYAADLYEMFYQTYKRDTYNQAATNKSQQIGYVNENSIGSIYDDYTMTVPNLWNIGDGADNSGNTKYISTYDGNGNNSDTINGYNEMKSSYPIFVINDVLGLLS